jgi:16S rRNA (uracil1498-N3)-methyltransferase
MKVPPWLLATSGELEAGRTIELDPMEVRHLSGALRRRTGDEVVLTDGRGLVAGARIVSIGKARVEAEIISVRREPAPRSSGVTIAMATISSRNMDWAVQKAVEVGVRRFVPLETERAQIRGGAVESRIDHWRRISMQALKQCRRAWAMEVADAVSFPDLVESSQRIGVVADREGSAIGDLPEGVAHLLVVGPEGGFTSAEKQLLERCGWPRLRLGPHILRAETAAIVGAAMMVAREEQLRVES